MRRWTESCPAIADAIIERIDLTDIVLDQVDLDRIVTRALDGLDLTQLVIDRVDIDALVAEADIEAVIDRVPIIPLANYVIDEIDLPQIIRDSTGGIATDAMGAVRVQGMGADQFVGRLADRVLLRRRQRKVDAPGDPESLWVGCSRHEGRRGEAPTSAAAGCAGPAMTTLPRVPRAAGGPEPGRALRRVDPEGAPGRSRASAPASSAAWSLPAST